ncbi:hypothetical protein Tco_0178727 [Tanacetum coccineum]
MDPSDAMHNPSQPLKVGKTLFQNSRRYTHFYRLSHFELVDIEKVALSSSSDSLELKSAILSLSKRDDPINSLGTLVINLSCYLTKCEFQVISLEFLAIILVFCQRLSEVVHKCSHNEGWKSCLSQHQTSFSWLFKDGGGVKEFQRSFRHSDTERLSRSDEVLKLKNFKKDATLKLSKSTNQERYEHVGPEVASSQDGKVSRWRRDYAWVDVSIA